MAGASAHARQPSGADGPSDDARNARLLAHLRTGVARLRKAPDEPAHELVIIEANAALEALVGGAPLVGRRLADIGNIGAARDLPWRSIAIDQHLLHAALPLRPRIPFHGATLLARRLLVL